MTVAELKVLMAALCDTEDDNIPLATALAWFEEADSDLAPVARIRVESEAEWEGGTEFAIPNDTVEVRQLQYDGEEIIPYSPHAPSGVTTYTRWGSTIVFSEDMAAADLTILYYRRPTALADEEDEPEIPVQFHRLYALWAAARYMVTHEDDFAKSQSFRAEYESLKAQLDRHTRRESGPPSFRPTFRW